MLPVLLLGIACYWFPAHVRVPYVWIALGTITVCVWKLRHARSTPAKMAWLNLAAVVLALGMLELYLWSTAPTPAEFAEEFEPSDGFVSHLDYGYGPVAPSRTHVVKLYEGKPIYDVFYTIDERGMRISPPELDAEHRRGCVLFFGCSYTFGEGVADEQTLPYQVGLKTQGRYAIRNMGFQGYGPHQMLSALESGEAERVADCKVTDVIYTALYWHALRVAGRSYWDHNGPRYVRDENGRAVRAGFFSDVGLHSRVPESILKRLKKSFVYQEYLAARVDPYEAPTRRGNVKLLSAIVERSRDEIARRFPGAAFHVLIWDSVLPPHLEAEATAAVTKPGVDVHNVKAVIRDQKDGFDPRYQISSGDRHPRAETYALVADYVASAVLHDAP